MAPFTCDGMLLSSFQNVFSTSVGVAFAYPILSQILDLKSEKALSECRRVMLIADKRGQKLDLERLGAERNRYQFRLEDISRMNSRLTTIASSVGVLAFLLLVFSTVSPPICLSFPASIWLCLLMSTPFLLGLLQVLRWYDNYAWLMGSISYYRGDHLWRNGRRSLSPS